MELASRLRAARERLGWSVEEVGAQLRLPARVIERVEAGDLDGLGAPIYRRGYLRSFARLVGLGEDEIAAALEQAGSGEPELVATGVQPRGQYMLERFVRPASYIALTALIALPVVWWAASGRLGEELTAVRSFDLRISADELAGGQPVAPATAASVRSDESALVRASLVALPPEARPLPPAPVREAAPDREGGDVAVLVAGSGQREAILELAADSWVDVVDAQGQRVHQALMRPGQWRFRGEGPLSFTIGNSQSARLIVDGDDLDLSAHRSANNVARVEVFATN